MNAREMRAKAAKLKAEAQSLYEQHRESDDGMPDDEAARYDGLLDQAEGLIARAEADERRYARLGAVHAPSPVESEPALPESRHHEASGDRITPGAQAADRNRNMGDFLKLVAIVADRQADRRTQERAQERLGNCYRSKYCAWDDGSRSPEVRAMAQSSGTTGGYLVPVDFYDELMSSAEEEAIVRRFARKIPMDADEVMIPTLDVTTVPTAGNSPFLGGMYASWSGEAATIGERSPGFRQDRLIAYELTGYTEISRTLIQNSAITVDVIIRDLFARAVAWHEDYAFLVGDGKGKPLGVQKSAAFLATGTARGSSTAISFANALAMYAKLLPSSMGKAIWIVTAGATFSAVLAMTGSANSVMVPAGYYGPLAAQSPINMGLIGRPIFVSEKTPALDTYGDIGLYDFGYYLIGDRRQIEVAASEHFKFQSNQIAYRFVHRVGGMPWLNNYITLQDASTTVSPFVGLTIQ